MTQLGNDLKGEEPLRLGFIGLGMAAASVIEEIRSLPFVEIVAAADPRANAREQFRREFGDHVYGSVEELCASDLPEVVYIATPHEFHAEHAILAAKSGKHIITEKPMATSMDDAISMVEAADEAGVQLMCGHTHSFDPPVQKMAQIAQSGVYGKTLLINSLFYKSFIYRPFSDHDIETSHGVVLNQGPHQLDIVRLIGGGLVRSVRAGTGQWDPDRPGIGHYAALVFFENGLIASVVFDGYALFDSAELVWDLGEGGELRDPTGRREMRKTIRSLKGSDRHHEIAALLEPLRYGGDSRQRKVAAQRYQVGHAPSGERKGQPFFGMTIVTCEQAEIRQSRDGIYVYTEDGRQELSLPQGVSGRYAEVREMWEALRRGRSVEHDGRWGAATLEVCLAIIKSAETGQDVEMSRQVSSGCLLD